MSTDREREALAFSIDRACLIGIGGYTPAGADALMKHSRTPSDNGKLIAAAVEAAGWMPRPEPGTEAWEAMVERGAKAIWEQPGSGCSWQRLEEHVKDQCRRDADDALRAALGTGGKDGE